VVGADLRFKLPRMILTSEHVRHFSKSANSWTGYIEPSFYIYREELLLYTFVDYADAETNLTGSGKTAISDPYKKYEYGAGLNWLPTSYTRFRLGFSINDYVGNTARIQGQSRNYIALDTSAGIAF
jgi:hypothetical protein